MKSAKLFLRIAYFFIASSIFYNSGCTYVRNYWESIKPLVQEEMPLVFGTGKETTQESSRLIKMIENESLKETKDKKL